MKTNDKNSKKRAAPPRYDEAFRAGAVRMVTEQGRPSKEVAQVSPSRQNRQEKG